MIIRQAIQDDIDDLYAFGLTIPEINISSQVEFMSKEELRNTLSNSDAVTFLASKNDKIIGFCLAQIGEPDHYVDPSFACLMYIAIANEWKRIGLATLLYKNVFNELKRKGITYIYAWACPTSGAIDFLIKQGMISGRTCVWMDMKI